MTENTRPPVSARRRLLRRLLVSVLLIAGAWQLLGFLLNRSLTSAKAEYQGPSLAFADHLPTPLPDGAPNAWDAVEAARLLLDGQKAIDHPRAPVPRRQHPGTEAIHQRLRELDGQGRRPAAADLELFRARLAEVELPLAVLSYALANAPEARFATDYGVPPATLEIPNLLYSLRLASLLRARAAVAVAEGHAADAWRDAKNLYRLAYWTTTTTRTLIGALVGRAVARQGDRQVRALLGEAPADAATREPVLAEARRIEPGALFDQAFAAEAAALYSSLLDERLGGQDLDGLLAPQEGLAPWAAARLADWQPWRRYNAAAYLRWSSRAMAICAPPAYRQEDGPARLAAAKPPVWVRPAVDLTYDCLESAAKRDLWRASLDQLEIALALEKHREENGGYPPSLAAAGPDLAARLDPFSGQPYRYLPEAGGYRLYSVSLDRQDGGGQEVLGADGQVDISQGDWLWRVEKPAPGP
jgi:hypothetical protein